MKPLFEFIFPDTTGLELPELPRRTPAEYMAWLDQENRARWQEGRFSGGLMPCKALFRWSDEAVQTAESTRRPDRAQH